jgi:multidrug efflux pump subunit AcrA (membrane-fusion protein)
MGEDLGQLRGARENFQEDIGRERTNLITQQAQARFDFQQSQLAAAASAAAAARSATNAADRAAAERAQDLLDSSDPLTRATSRGIELGYVDFDPVKVQDAYNGWMINRGTTPTAAGRTSWDKGSAIADAMKFIGDQLSNDEKRALQEAIGNSY